MKIPNVVHCNYGQNKPTGCGNHKLTYREIYETINHRDDFNEPQLFYLNRLLERKIRAFDPWRNADDLETKPYLARK